MVSYEIDIFIRDKDGEVSRKWNVIVDDVLPTQTVEVYVNNTLKFEDEVYEEED